MSYIIQGIDYNQKHFHWIDLCKSQNYEDIMEEIAYYNANKADVNFGFRIIARKENIIGEH